MLYYFVSWHVFEKKIGKLLAVLRDVTPSSLVGSDVSEESADFISTVFTRLHGVTWRKIITAVITSDFTFCNSLPLAEDDLYLRLLMCREVIICISVGAQSKAWTAFTRPSTESVSSNPTGGMDVCVRLFSVCVLCVGSGLATGWSPVQGVLPTVCRIRKTGKEAKAQQEGL
jgi:hypothetical protein